MERPPSTRRFDPSALATAAVAAVGTVLAAVAADPVQPRRHLDHIVYEATIRAVHHGQGAYDAFVASMDLIGADVDQVRVMREPWLFDGLALLPDRWLFGTFFAVVVLGSTLLAIPLVRLRPMALVVGGWLAIAGTLGGVDAWLLFELWCVPLLLAACLAHTRGRDGWAAACCVGAFLIRETVVFLPLGFLVAALVARRPWRPWVASLAGCTVGLGVHWALARSHLEPGGHSAPLLGTGDIQAVAHMTAFLVVPDLVGLLVWAAGLVCLWRTDLRPAIGLAALPVVGLVADRPYWGWLAMPLCLVGIGRYLDGFTTAGAASSTSPSPPDRAAT